MKKLQAVLIAVCVILAVGIVLVVIAGKKESEPAPNTTQAAGRSVSEADFNVEGASDTQAETSAAAQTSAPTTSAPTTAAPTTAAPMTAAQSENWKQAYRAYLNTYPADAYNQVCVALIYLDNDDIPEMAVCDGSYHAALWTVMTCRGGTVKEIGAFGGWGTMQYFERAATIHSGYGNQGMWTENVYRIENGEAVSVWEAQGEMAADGELYYDADGNPLTEAQYNAQLNAALPANADQCSRTIAYKTDGWMLTDANIEQYLR